LAATTLASGLVLIVTTVVCIVRKNVLKKRKGNYALHLDSEGLLVIHF